MTAMNGPRSGGMTSTSHRPSRDHAGAVQHADEHRGGDHHGDHRDDRSAVCLDPLGLVVGFGKLTTSAIAAAIMNSRASGNDRRAPSITRRPTVSARLNQISFGRRVARLGSRPTTPCRSCPPGSPVSRSGLPATGGASSGRAERPPIAGDAGAADRIPASRPHGFPGAPGAPASRLRSAGPAARRSTSTVTSAGDQRRGSSGRTTRSATTFSTVAARTVGPPQGTMFRVPLARPATQVSTTGLIPSRR